MRLELKGFQDDAVVRLLRAVRHAQASHREMHTDQAIVFTAPTAAGKTVMMAAAIEEMLTGGKLASQSNFEPDPQLTVLWLSDRPELNEQSRQKLIDIISALPARTFVPILNTFDQATFDEGAVYFLNYQKLSSSGLLTRVGDSRAHTIWETIANTQAARPGKLIVVIDEAHYGVGKSNKEAGQARTNAQRFFLGGGTDVTIRGADGQLKPFPGAQIIVGVSATPQRLEDFLGANPSRGRIPVSVAPAAVRESGLIKDRIMLHAPDGDHPTMTLLAAAAEQLTVMADAWADHHREHGNTLVSPALIVQVENGDATHRTRTSLSDVIGTLRRALPDLRPEETVHCFGDGGDLEVSPDWIIRSAEPNSLQADATVRVVLFKTALNTGWDCPRAEVMMSFRSAEDPTSIAQLIGRMVRTPLAQRIGEDEVLNATYLYLPFYDRAELERTKNVLTGDGSVAEVEEAAETQQLVLRPDGRPLFNKLRSLPTEVAPGGRRLSDLKRVLKLARLLEQDGVDPGAVRSTMARLESVLEARHLAVAAADDYEVALQTAQHISVASFAWENGEMVEVATHEVAVVEADIDQQFRLASTVLEEPVARAWLKKRFDPVYPLAAKIEVIRFAADGALRSELETAANSMFRSLLGAHLPAIDGLENNRRDLYADLQRNGRYRQWALMEPQERVIYPKPAAAVQWAHHLYVDEGAENFSADLNGWEQQVLRAEMARTDFRGWVRNLPRRPSSLSYTYDFNGTQLGYPDLLCFREVAGELRVDVLEPHGPLEDSVAKVHGLARFSEERGACFGRIEFIRCDDGAIQRISLDDPGIRAAISTGLKAAEDLKAFLK